MLLRKAVDVYATIRDKLYADAAYVSIRTEPSMLVCGNDIRVHPGLEKCRVGFPCAEFGDQSAVLVLRSMRSAISAQADHGK
jgi:hypothetical protein